jgi:LPS sulfotransferase NodH
VLGTPEEYFHRGDEQFWRGRWGVSTGTASSGQRGRRPSPPIRGRRRPPAGLAAARPAGETPARPPKFDRAAIGRLVRFAEECESGWRQWFSAHSIRPFEIVYEDMAENPDKAVHGVAGFLEIALPPGLAPVRARLQRQADEHTERLARLFGNPRA